MIKHIDLTLKIRKIGSWYDSITIITDQDDGLETYTKDSLSNEEYDESIAQLKLIIDKLIYLKDKDNK